jgi:chromate transporter
MSVLADIAAAWFRVGVFGFGGGPSVIPLIHAECVDRYHWLDEGAFLDALAFGNALPGPIAVKLAAYIGKVAGGWPGAVVAVTTMSVPGVALMLAIGGLWARYRENPAVAGMMRGVRPAVVGLLAFTVWELAPDGVRGVGGVIVAAAAFVALLLHVHPALVMAVAMVTGAVFLR